MMPSPIQLDQEDVNDDVTVNEGIVEEGNFVITKVGTVGTVGTVATSVKMKFEHIVHLQASNVSFANAYHDCKHTIGRGVLVC